MDAFFLLFLSLCFFFAFCCLMLLVMSRSNESPLKNQSGMDGDGRIGNVYYLGNELMMNAIKSCREEIKNLELLEST